MIKKVDGDGDGMVNFIEFKRMMKAGGFTTTSELIHKHIGFERKTPNLQNDLHNLQNIELFSMQAHVYDSSDKPMPILSSPAAPEPSSLDEAHQ
ncbi:hypothetical protein K1719_041367 [Acacia pycnantha]|nr:hypothetical protein K1719_041367 [Acacia pycnantha]